MNPNIALVSTPRLMQDVMPPYAAALTNLQTSRSEAPTPTQSPDANIPVKRESTEEAVMFPQVAEANKQENPAQPVVPEAHQEPTPAVAEKAHQPIQQTIDTPKTNWLIITMAVLVSAALFFAAYMAFSQNR